MITLLILCLLTSDIASKSVCDNLNVVRAEANSTPLALDAGLCALAKTQAEKCAARGMMFHSSNRPVGVEEGVCFHFLDPVYALATRQTPLHRADAIDPNCRRLGVGYAYSRQGVIFWVLQYAP